MPYAIEDRDSCLGPIRVRRADSFFTRLGGLLILPRLQTGEVLLLSPCSGVHTIGMAYALALVFLDAQGRVTGWRESVPPMRLAPGPAGTREVLEMLPETLARRRLSLMTGRLFWDGGAVP